MQGRKLKRVEERAKDDAAAAAASASDEGAPKDMAAVLHARLNAMHKVMRADSEDEGDGDDGWTSDE